MPSSQPLAGQRILVTRPAHQAEGQVSQLEALGAEALRLPLLEIQPFEETDTAPWQAIKRCILDLDLYQSVIFVSANAARIGANWIHDYWPQLPLGVNWFAIGAATAHALAELGIEARHVAGGFDSEALLADPLLANPSGERILILRGTGGRELLAQTLRARGAKVDYADLYRRCAPNHAPADIKSTIYTQDLSGILVTSGEALNNLLSLTDAVPEVLHILQSTVLVVPSVRVASLATERGFSQIRVAEGPDDMSMIRALLPADCAVT